MNLGSGPCHTGDWGAAGGQAPGAAVPVLFFSSASSTRWPLSGEGGQIIGRKDERAFRALPWGRRAVVSGVQRGSLPGKRASSVGKQNSPGEKDPGRAQQSLVLPRSISTGSPGGGTAAASLRGADGLRGVSIMLDTAQHQSEEESGSKTTCLSLLLLLLPGLGVGLWPAGPEHSPRGRKRRRSVWRCRAWGHIILHVPLFLLALRPVTKSTG